MKKIKVSIESSNKQCITVGEVIDNPMIHDEQKVIINNISTALSKLFNNPPAFIDDFNSKIDNGAHNEAFIILSDNIQLLTLYKNTNFTQSILKLNTRILSEEELKKYYQYLIFVASIEGSYELVETEANNYYEKFRSTLENQELLNLILFRANVASRLRKYHLASELYSSIIKSDYEVDALILSWTYRGLELIAENDKDMIYFSLRAFDKWMEAGNKIEATTELMSISRKYQSTDARMALKYIDDAIAINDINSPLQKELVASLYHSKATFLMVLGNYEQAFQYAEQSCKLRSSLICNEISQHASNALAIELLEKLDKKSEIEYYQNQNIVLEQLIKDDDFLLRVKLSKYIKEYQDITVDVLQNVISSGSYHTKLAIYLYCAIRQNISFERKLELIDNALSLVKECSTNEFDLASIYSTLGLIYMGENEIERAIDSYEKALSYNSYDNTAAQNCGALLFNSGYWQKAREFFKSRLEINGELPNLMYIYAKTLFNCGDYQEAFQYFKKVKYFNDFVDIDEYIGKCIENCDSIITVKPFIKETPQYVSFQALFESLKQITQNISRQSRMSFWKNDKGKHSWVSSPENYGKNLLIQGLSAKYPEMNIYQEKVAGAGIIDLYLTLPGGLKAIIELKMCGFGYSSTYAISGQEQVIHYQENSDAHVLFLIVFDGRTKENGSCIEDITNTDSYTIYNIVVDINPKVK